MKRINKSLFIFLVSLSLCVACVGIAHYWTEPREQFQQKVVASPLLAYGETGKILHQLGAIQPQENKTSVQRITINPVEFTRRAFTERQKWLNLESFRKYKTAGIFGYLEVESKEADVPFYIHVMIDDTWVKLVSSHITPDRTVVPFFLDIDGDDLTFMLSFKITSQPVRIHGVSFLQNDYHPLVFTDKVGFANLFRKSQTDAFQINTNSLEILPQDQVTSVVGRLSFQTKRMIGISKFHKKLGSTQIDLVASKHHPLKSKQRLSDEQLAAISKAKIPVVSITIDNEDLHSEKFGILTNFDGHGRKWERLGYGRYFRDGKAVFSNFVGVRLQGGDPGREKGLINFRLFFREEYGKSSIAADKLFTGTAGEIKRVAIKQSEWSDWPLNSPISYDISRQIGALAPPTEIHLLYLNGEPLGLYYMTPHLGEKQVKLLLPEEDYLYYRLRSKPHHADNHFIVGDFFQKIGDAPVMTEAYASQFFDLDNLTRQLFSYMANGTGDFCQGIILKGTSPESKVFWYSWDMDQSYVDVPVEIINEDIQPRERWEQPPAVRTFLYDERGKKKHFCPRVSLFRRLVNEDPQFREKTKHLFASILNHQLTPEFLNELLDNYHQKLAKISYPGGEEYIESIRTFLRMRKPFLLEEMEKNFSTDHIVTCRVTADTYPVTVDGYIKTGPYKGHYFPGATLRLGSGNTQKLERWLVNGEEYASEPTELLITAGQECAIHGVL